jgi:hypothetical protein
MRLWLEINVKSAETKADVFTLLRKPEFDPLKRLSEGYVSVFKDIMSLLEEHEAWDDIFAISQEVLTRGTNLLSETEIGAKKEAEARAIRSAVMDWSLWKQFIHAACRLKDDKRYCGTNPDNTRQSHANMPQSTRAAAHIFLKIVREYQAPSHYSEAAGPSKAFGSVRKPWPEPRVGGIGYATDIKRANRPAGDICRLKLQSGVLFRGS